MDRWKATQRMMLFVMFGIIAYLTEMVIPGEMPWFFWALFGYAGGMMATRAALHDDEDKSDTP